MTEHKYYCIDTSKPGLGNFAKSFVDAGIFFPIANVCNFMQGGNPIATKIALFNLAYSTAFIGLKAFKQNLPDNHGAKKVLNSFSQFLSDQSPTRNILTRAFRLVRDELSDPLRVTSYCAVAIGGLLLVSASGGAGAALFPGLAGIFFGIGNYLQSSARITKYRLNPNSNSFLKAFYHPAVWYGLGYTMTGIGIGGGLGLLAHPLVKPTSSLLTALGITETVASLGLMASGKIKNPAVLYVGIALGTLVFAATGLTTGNELGFATGLAACAGELSLAAAMQRLYNMTPLRMARNNELVQPTGRRPQTLFASGLKLYKRKAIRCSPNFNIT